MTPKYTHARVDGSKNQHYLHVCLKQVAEEVDLVNAVRNINDKWQDVDARGKYEMSDFMDGGFDYKSTNEFIIEYSDIFRGKMRIHQSSIFLGKLTPQVS